MAKVTGIDGAHGLELLAADFDRASRVVPVEVRKVVQKGALNIKTDARRRASGLAHAPAYPFSITYDTEIKSSRVEAEIGPDKERRQGALGNILEFGSVHNPPIPHMAPAAQAELPRFEKACQDLAVKATGLP